MNEIDLTQAGIVLAAVLAGLILLSFVLGRPRRRKGPVRVAAATRPDRDVLRAEFAIALRQSEDRAERLAEDLRIARIALARLEIAGGAAAPVGTAPPVVMAPPVVSAPPASPEPAAAATVPYGAAAPALATPPAPARATADDSEMLRERLTALAAEVAAVTAAIEGRGGPIDSLIAGSDGATDSLADRIRRLRERVPASQPADTVPHN